MIHPDNENRTRPAPDEPEANLNQEPQFVLQLEKELELLEEKFESFITVNSLRRHFER